jgi:hypothetical protein
MSETMPQSFEFELPDFPTPPGSKKTRANVSGDSPGTVKNKTPSGRPTTVQKELDLLEIELNKHVSMIALIVMTREPFDGQIIAGNQDRFIKAWLEVARTNAKLRKALIRITSVGAYGEAVTATLAIVAPILAHHRIIPNADAVLGFCYRSPMVMMPDPNETASLNALFKAGENGNHPNAIHDD